MTAGMDREDDHSPAGSDAMSPRSDATLAVCYALADQDFHRTKSLGIFNLSVGLLRALARQPEVGHLHVLANRAMTTFLPVGGAVRVAEHNQPLGGRLSRIWWDQFGLARAARLAGCHWTYLPKGFVPWWAPLPGQVACYVHDAIHEFFRERYPQAFSGLEARYFSYSLRQTVRRAQVIFTNSEFTRQEVLRCARGMGVAAPPAIVAGIGFEMPPVGTPGKADGIVSLASRWPHKRTDLAIRYLDQWQRETGYTGTIDWVGDSPASLAWPARANWRRHPRLDHQAYEQLLRASRALVFFTEYEGFGMPPVESVLLGTCPVYSRLPVTIEVMGDRGQPFDNEDYGSFRRALDQALATPPSLLGAWGEALRRRFTWQSAAERVVRGLSDAGSKSRRRGAA